MKRLPARAFAATLALALFCGATGAAHIVRKPIPPSPVPILTPSAEGDEWSAAEIASLQTDLDAQLTNAPPLRGAHFGMYAIDTRTGNVLYARNNDDVFQVASTLKLIVGSAALDKLGPEYRFKTEASLTTRAPVEPAHPVPFDMLLIRGGGDPLLSAADIDDAARAVARTQGKLEGGWLVDDSHFDLVPYAAGWSWDDFAFDYAAPLSAASLEENVIHLTIAPAGVAGARAAVHSAPLNVVRTPIEGGCNRVLIVVADAMTGAANSESTLDVARNRFGCIHFTGIVPASGPAESLDAAVPDPVEYLHNYAGTALRRAGVDARIWGGIPRESTYRSYGVADRPIRTIWTHRSASLGEFLGPNFWIPSDNFVGEMLLKELGFVTGGKPGTTAKGIAYEKSWLKSIGVDLSTVTLADGSGLSQYDRVTPRALVAILQHDWNGPYRALVLNSLPVGGAHGSIEGITGTAAAGRVFAKTGSMMHVRGLAGYLATKRHGAVTFAFTVDDWNGDYPALAALRAAALARIVSD